MFFYIFKKEN